MSIVVRVGEVFQYKAMLWSMILSELRTRYKGSVLGFLWTFVNPLLQLLVYTFIFSIVMRANIKHYAVFMFIGLLSWNMFAAGVQGACSVINGKASLVKKIYFPREILPLSVVGGAVVNYVLSLSILFVFLIANGYYPSVLWLFTPLLLLIETLLTVGFALAFSALNVFARDLEHMLGIFLMLWFYLTPVLFNLDMLPAKYASLFKLNPMAPIVLSYQQIFYYGQQPHWKILIYGSGVAVLILVLGWSIFNRLNRRFAEEV